MRAIDFETALAQLLASTALRESFRGDPVMTSELLAVQAGDRPALLQLSADDLERQAQTLLRKRLEGIRAVLPVCCHRLGHELWTEFCKMAKCQEGKTIAGSRNLFAAGPAGRAAVLQSALDFALYLKRVQPSVVCHSELNRVRFFLGQNRLRIHVVWEHRFARCRIPSLQVLLRRAGRCREFTIYLAGFGES